MKRNKIILILLLSFAAVQAQAESYDSQFSLSLDLLGQAAFASSGPSGSSIGVGGSFFADWRPLPYLSLGTGLDFTSYSTAGGWQTSAWNLGGRIFPAPSENGGEFYLQGTLGLNLIQTSLMHKWPGSLHSSAGVGYRIFMDKNNALDLGGQYDFYSPLKNPLSDVGVKVGWTFLFGGNPTVDKEKAVISSPNKQSPTAVKSKSDALYLAPGNSKKPPHSKSKNKPKKKNVPLTPTPTASAANVYTWTAGDQLESLAEAYFGRGNLYPLIVDANKASLKTSAGLVAGVKLVIPENPTEADKAGARAKAEFTEYLIWAKVGKPF